MRWLEDWRAEMNEQARLEKALEETLEEIEWITSQRPTESRAWELAEAEKTADELEYALAQLEVGAK